VVVKEVIMGNSMTMTKTKTKTKAKTKAKNEIEDLLNVYKNVSKNNRGDLMSSLSAPSFLINSLTGKEEPVYSIEEANLLEEIDRIRYEIIELEDFSEAAMYEVERKRILKDIDNLFEKWDVTREALFQLRSKSKDKLDKLAVIRKAENKERMAKKKAKDIERIKQKAKDDEFKEIVNSLVPDDLKESMKRLF